MAKAYKKQSLGRGLSALLENQENDINSAQDSNADKLIAVSYTHLTLPTTPYV